MKNTVKLIDDQGTVKDFEYAHAVRLLNFEKKLNLNNYQIAEKDFEYIDGTIVRRNTKENQRAEKRSTPTEGTV